MNLFKFMWRPRPPPARYLLRPPACVLSPFTAGGRNRVCVSDKGNGYGCHSDYEPFCQFYPSRADQGVGHGAVGRPFNPCSGKTVLWRRTRDGSNSELVLPVF